MLRKVRIYIKIKDEPHKKTIWSEEVGLFLK